MPSNLPKSTDVPELSRSKLLSRSSQQILSQFKHHVVWRKEERVSAWKAWGGELKEGFPEQMMSVLSCTIWAGVCKAGEARGKGSKNKGTVGGATEVSRDATNQARLAMRQEWEPSASSCRTQAASERFQAGEWCDHFNHLRRCITNGNQKRSIGVVSCSLINPHVNYLTDPKSVKL